MQLCQFQFEGSRIFFALLGTQFKTVFLFCFSSSSSAEDIVGTAIALVKDDINKANDNSIQGVSKYVGEVTAQLERLDSDLRERAPDESTEGAVITITALTPGSTGFTMTSVGESDADGDMPDLGFSVAQAA